MHLLGMMIHIDDSAAVSISCPAFRHLPCELKMFRSMWPRLRDT